MDVIGDLVARERRSDRPALRVDGAASYSYRDLCTTAWKAGNVLRHYGVAAGREVAIEPVARPAPLLTFLGAACIGATTRFDPREGTDARAVLVPVEDESTYDLAPGSKLFVYGGRPSDPGAIHWETDVWSENPALPPYEVDADDPALAVDGRTHAHRDLLDAAGSVVEEYGFDADTRVAVRGRLGHPGVVVAGVLAPLLAGGTVVVGDGWCDADAAVGTDATAAGGDDEPDAPSTRIVTSDAFGG